MSTEAEVAWAAGIFEGEGCITWHGGGRPMLAVNMTDEDVLRRFADVVGGKVYGPCQGKGATWKPYFRWYVQGNERTERVLALFQPWLGRRRTARASEVLSGNKEEVNACTPGTGCFCVRHQCCCKVCGCGRVKS